MVKVQGLGLSKTELTLAFTLVQSQNEIVAGAGEFQSLAIESVIGDLAQSSLEDLFHGRNVPWSAAGHHR